MQIFGEIPFIKPQNESSATFFCAFDDIRNTVVTIVALPRGWEEGHGQNKYVSASNK